jgi:hypothetical protein
MLLSTTEERSIMDDNANASQTDAGEVRHGLIGLLRAGDSHVQQSAAVLATAKGGADLHQSASVALVSGGDTSMTMSAAVAVPTLGDLRIEKGAAQWAIAAGDVSFDRAGCAVAVAPTVKVDRGGVGVALGWHVDVGENSRVLFGPLAAVGLGLAFGVGVGLVMAASAGYAAKKALRSMPRLPWRP